MDDLFAALQDVPHGATVEVAYRKWADAEQGVHCAVSAKMQRQVFPLRRCAQQRGPLGSGGLDLGKATRPLLLVDRSFPLQEWINSNSWSDLLPALFPDPRLH